MVGDTVTTDESTRTREPGHDRGTSLLRRLRPEHWLVAALVLTVFVVALLNLANGHDWGDDFALYISQAKAIAHFDPGPVVASNLYSKAHSSWSTFSPDAYPWGFPLLLAPLYAIWGINFGVFQIMQCAFFAVFIGLLALLFMPRVGRFAGMLLVLLLGSSVVYLAWAQSVTADFPFMAFVALTLLLIDRARRAGWFSGAGTGLLVGVGLAAGFATSIRREGIVLFAAVGAAQLAGLVSDRLALPKDRRPRLWRGLPWKRASLPHAAGLGLLVLFQIVFPGPFANGYPGTGLGQLKSNAIWFRDILAQTIGLMDAGAPSLRFGGSETLAKWMLGIFVVGALIGFVYRLITAWRDDVALAVYLVAVVLVVGSLPFHEGRYLFTITPFLAYFAYQGIKAAARLASFRVAKGRWAILPGVVGGLFIFALLVPNYTDLRHRTEIRIEYRSYVMWGPADPASVEMFATVRERVPPADVVGFFRGRAMNLFGERQGLYLTTLPQILERADWYVMEKNSTYSQYVLTDEEAAANGITKVWENRKFVLWKVP